MEMTKTSHDQVIKLPHFVMSVLRWHVWVEELKEHASATVYGGASMAFASGTLMWTP